MKQFISILICYTLFLSASARKITDFTQYVNPLIGTDIHKNANGKNTSEEKGQTMPSVGAPNGKTNWVAQTLAGEKKCDPPYYYYHSAIQGFRASHWLNGSCTQDYGSVTIMPLSGTLETDPGKRASAFSHSQEVATPYDYHVFLSDYSIDAALTGLSHSGFLRFDFKKNDNRYIVVEPNSDEGLAYIEIHPEKKEITGYNPAHRIYQGWGESAGFSGYFVIRFEDEFESFGTWKDKQINESAKSAQGEKNKVGAWIKLSAKPGQVKVKVGTSFTGIDNARLNLDEEIPGWDFEKVRQTSKKLWNQALGQIAVKSEDKDKLTKFYSALKNTRLYPRVFSDVNGDYPGFSENYTTHNDGFTYYCDFSLWDTHRAVHPLLTILQPKMSGEMIRSFITKGASGGWLPIFPMWNNYTAAMIGDHGLSIISDAIIKNIPGFDYEKAYQLMRKNAFDINADSTSYVDGKGRRALESYLKYNYIPLEDSVWQAFHRREQVSRTLEYAYDDYALSQAAKKLGKTADYTDLSQRSQNYRNVIDPETGYARGRHADGSWIEPFNPNQFTNFICEGTPFHYTWYVPQDVPGLISHIGRERFISHLDTFFEEGYYWHGNEPCHHIPYLFAMAGEAWKTQKWVHEIIDREYFTSPDGLCGNDDAGQMSAWLVFSMMGFYPVCPGTPYYILGSPSFEEITLSLENGKKFKIEAKGLTKDCIYIQSAKLNGKPYNQFFITHDDIINGGTLSLVMGDKPKK